MKLGRLGLILHRPPALPQLTIVTGNQECPENAAFDVTLTSDAEGVAWSIVAGGDAAYFSLSVATLTLSSRNYEAPADANADNVYSVTVRGEAAGYRANEKTLSFTVTNIAEPGPSEATHTLTPTGSQLLSIATLDPVPSENDVLFSSTALSPVEHVWTPAYRTGDALITPGGSYTGTIESGYAGDVPTQADYPRTGNGQVSSCWLSIPSRQFSADMDVGVFARPDQTDRVDFYFENPTPVSVSSPTLRTTVWADGVPRSQYGYWATLDHSAFMAVGSGTRAINGFAVVHPKAGLGLSPRLLGFSVAENKYMYETFRCFAVSDMFDMRIEVDHLATPAYNASAVYPSPKAVVTHIDEALKFAAGQTTTDLGAGLGGYANGAKRAEILCKQTHRYTPVTNYVSDPNPNQGYTKGEGYHYLRTDDGVTVTIGRDSYSASVQSWDPNFAGLWIEGPGFVFDLSYQTSFPHAAEPTNSETYKRLWQPAMLDCVQTRSDFDWQVANYHDKTVIQHTVSPNKRWIFAQGSDLKYCSATGLALAQHNTFSGFYSDLLPGVVAAVGNICHDMDKGPHYQDYPAFTLAYSGTPNRARLRAQTNAYDTASRTIYMEEDDGSGTWATLRGSISVASYPDAATLTARINELGGAYGWTASAPTQASGSIGDKHMRYLVQNYGKNFNNTLTSTPLTYSVWYDLHSDIFQLSDNWAEDNLVYVFNRTYNTSGVQILNVTSDADAVARDFLLAWNSFQTTQPLYVSSDWGFDRAQFIGNFVSGNIQLRNSGGRFSSNVNCELIGNVASSLTLQAGSTSNVYGWSIVDNHFTHSTVTATSSVGATISGNTTGSDVSTLAPNHEAGDPTPDPTAHASIGLKALPWAASESVGMDGRRFEEATVPRGPKPFRVDSETLTVQQGKDLVAVTYAAAEGEEVATAELEYYTSPANTGEQEITTLSYDVAAA